MESNGTEQNNVIDPERHISTFRYHPPVGTEQGRESSFRRSKRGKSYKRLRKTFTKNGSTSSLVDKDQITLINTTYLPKTLRAHTHTKHEKRTRLIYSEEKTR